MKATKLVYGGAILTILACLATTGVARAQDDATMDHAAMASSYQAEAKEAQAKVASHELMLSRYKNMPTTPKGAPVPKEAMVKHCQKLVDSYKEAAGQATDLAKAHQEAASAAK
jgi:hypothetical protein